jgi:hypothetical protein
MRLLTSDTKVRELRLTFAGEGKEGGVAVARFQPDAKLATDASEGSEDLSATIDLAGELLVARATGLVLSIQMTGPVNASATVKEAGQELELVGTGTWTIDYTAKVE